MSSVEAKLEAMDKTGKTAGWFPDWEAMLLKVEEICVPAVKALLR